MSDRMRLTGMYSGMDTETIVQELVKTKQTKVDNLKNEQKKLEWKQTAWQDLNSKIYNLYSNTLSNLRLSGSFKKKSTTSSDATKATVTAGGSAVNGTQSLKINQLAKTGYLTGAKINVGTKLAGTDNLSKITGDLTGKKISVTAKVTLAKGEEYKDEVSGVTKIAEGGEKINKTTQIDFTNDMTINNFVSKLKEAGVNANFDENNQRFFISSKDMGLENDFKIDDVNGGNVLSALGLDEKGYVSGTALSGTSHKADTKLIDIDPDLVGKTINFENGSSTSSLTIDNDTTIEAFLKAANASGVTAKFDEDKQQFVFTTPDGSSASDFTISVAGEPDNSSLAKLGLDHTTFAKGSDCTRIKGQDAEIELNGAAFTSDSNTFDINGLTINALGTTDADEEISLVTSTDIDGIYNTVKDFFEEYNELINEMDKLYNADSARKYNMLSDDEKEAMTDEEVEQWEDKIKGSLLRKDSSLSNVMNSMINSLMGGYLTTSDLSDKDKAAMTSGEYDAWKKKNTKYLSDYGISTLSYFDAKDNERHAYHIDGNSEDENTKDKEDKLRAAITKDPDGTADFFANLFKDMYTKIDKVMMDRTDFSSVYKVYNDKKLQKEYDDYTSKIKKAEDELNDYEDKWYDKFTAMETALAKLQSNQSSISSMLGM